MYSSDGQSIEVPSKDPDEVLPWELEGWGALFEDHGRIDNDRGGFGVVHRVKSRTGRGEFALKAQKSRDAISTARFKREIEQQRALADHPHIVDVEDFGADFDWYTMPLAAGTLSEVASSLSDDEIGQCLVHIASGLDAAHKKNFVHRDVKPANILLLRSEIYGVKHWVVSDFGLAKAPKGQSHELKTSTPLGTRGYMAPELLVSPHDDATPAADVYSLGRTLALMCTGKPPLEFAPSAVTGVWAGLVGSMTELDMSERPTMQQVIASATEILEMLAEQRRHSSRKSGIIIDRREEHVLWTLMDKGDDESPRSHPRMRATEIRPGNLSVGEVRVALQRLSHHDMVKHTPIAGDEYEFMEWVLTSIGMQYLDAHVDRLATLFSPTPSEPSSDSLPF